jgi:hypothetical protein
VPHLGRPVPRDLDRHPFGRNARYVADSYLYGKSSFSCSRFRRGSSCGSRASSFDMVLKMITGYKRVIILMHFNF